MVKTPALKSAKKSPTSVSTENSTSAKSTPKHPSLRKPRPATPHPFRTALTLVLWAFLSIFFSQLLFALIFQLLLGSAFAESTWATVYSAVYYAFSVFLIIFIPYKFPRRFPVFLLATSALIFLYYLLILIITFVNYGVNFANFWEVFTFMGHLGLIVSIFGIIFSIILIVQTRSEEKKSAPAPKNSAKSTPETTIQTQAVKSTAQATTSQTSPITTPPTREQLGLSGLPTWTDLGLAPIGYVVALLLGAVLAAIFSIFPWFDASQTQDVGFNEVYSTLDRLVTFLALVIIAPIAEELIFRGWLYGKLRSFLNLPVAMLITSLLFGLMHGQWNVGITVFAMSLVLCFAREITGTIYSGIIMHMLKNGIAFALLYILNFSY